MILIYLNLLLDLKLVHKIQIIFCAKELNISGKKLMFDNIRVSNLFKYFLICLPKTIIHVN